MIGQSLKAYHLLPPFARHLAASVRGYQLQRWRYGPETEGLVKEARERETWAPEQWQQWQQKRLVAMLSRAAESVPFYREQWHNRREPGESCSVLDLKNWPVLRKEVLRRKPAALLADDVCSRELRLERTSGTTGTPLRLWHSRSSTRRWYALMEARWRGWYGVSREDRWGILGGQLVTPVEQKSPPFWVWNTGLKQLYMSSYHLSAETCASYLQALRAHDVVYLWGHASSLHSLALLAHDQNLVTPQLKVIVSNAEPLFDSQRELIGKVFGCPVRDTYGMTEMVAAASECEHGTMHLWPEAGIVEILGDDSDDPVPPGTVGRMVCTGLISEDMPLIRYELGDRGALAPPAERCACGRTLPILRSIEGRQEDVIITPLGRRIGRLDPVFKADLPIHEAQIIQESQTKLLVRVVPDARFTASTSKQIVDALRDRVGDMKIALECVERIPRGQNGKFRGVVSLLGSAPRAVEPAVGADAEPTTHPPSHGHRQARFSRVLKAADRLYPRLPPWGQHIAVSLYGLTWRRERLGGDFDRHVSGFRARDRLTTEQMQAYLTGRLREVLVEACRRVPYYRNLWAMHGLNEHFLAGMDLGQLALLPVTPKGHVREDPSAFVDEDLARRHRLHQYSTSGSTGTPLTVFCTSDGHRRFVAAREVRSFGWAGTSLRKSRSMIGGRMVVPKGISAPPFHRYNLVERQTYFSAYHIAPQNAPHYVAALNRHRPAVFTGYAYSHFALAQMMLEQRLRLDYAPEALILGSEKLTAEMKLTIRDAFGARAFEEYGAVENCVLATECEAGRLHVHMDFGIMELVDADGKPVPPGVEGRILCTSLLNDAQPLVRYEIGDLGAWDPNPCPCGRVHLPVLKEVVGRLEDVVTGPDGRKMVRFHGIFVNVPHVVEGQVIQESFTKFRVRIVARDGFNSQDESSIRKRFHERLGPVSVQIENVDHIPRTANGKFRAVISLLEKPKQR